MPVEIAGFETTMKTLFAQKQAGIATILIMLVVGIAMTATALGVVYSVKSTQEKQVTSHALLNAQSVAWAAAEVFKQYVENPATNVAAIVASPSPIPVVLGIPAMQSTPPTITATATMKARGAQYVATITAIDTAAQSSALVELVFDSTPGVVATKQCDFGTGGEFLRTWDGTGGITAVGKNADGTPKYLDFSVDGDVNLASTAPQLGTLRATGNVTIATSSTELERIVANGCIKVSAGGFAKTLESSFSGPYGECLSAISLALGANAHTLRADGLINLASGDTDTVQSREGVIISGVTPVDTNPAPGSVIRGALGTPTNNGIHDLIVAGNDKAPASGYVTITGGAFGTISAVGSVDMGSQKVGSILSRGPFTWPAESEFWQKIKSPMPLNYVGPNLEISGTLTDCGAYGYTPITPVRLSATPTPVEAVVINRRTWNARDYIDNAIIPATGALPHEVANFYFFRDGPSTKVPIRHISNYADGDYFYNEADSRLCKNNNCSATDDATAKPICWTQNGTGENCVAYLAPVGADAGTFVVRGITLVPGAYAFEGNVNLSQSHGINTILATHNLTVDAGAHVNEALNWADYDKVCSAKFGDLSLANSNGASAATVFGSLITDGQQTTLGFNSAAPNDFIYQPFVGFYPTNLCQAGKYVRHNMANMAVAAGSVNATTGVFEGGVIATGSNAEFFGTVLAGDALVASQHTKIYGLLMALALNTTNPTLISTTGKVAINQSDVANHPNYTSQTGPGSGDPVDPNCTSTPGSLSLRWTRYL